MMLILKLLNIDCNTLESFQIMQGNPMQGLIDKLCDHLSVQRIKVLIESGFDDWETITFLKAIELVQLQFSSEECIIIMVAINAHAKELGQKEVFNEQAMQEALTAAKLKELELHERIHQQEIQKKLKEIKIQEKVQVVEQIKQYPPKPINEAVLLKGVTLKGKEKVPLNRVTLISLQQKELTHINEMEKVPSIINLYLGHNHIYQIQNLQSLKKLKILKLEANQIVKIEGLGSLQQLEQLFLNDNHISRLQGLTQNKNLHFVNLNQQKTKRSLQFDEQTCEALAYSLQTLYSDGNRIHNITSLRHLKVLNHLTLKNNALAEMGDLSEPLGSMERLKILDFRGNPLSSLPKYRDYMVILSKSLQQLDTKKILPKQREYLVKLYSLKHAKQVREEEAASKKLPQIKNKLDLHVTKLEEGSGQYAHNSDLRGNITYTNTKIQRK